MVESRNIRCLPADEGLIGTDCGTTVHRPSYRAVKSRKAGCRCVDKQLMGEGAAPQWLFLLTY